MQSIVISLNTAIQRRQHIEKEFGKQGISFSFFDAATPSTASILAEKLNLKFKENVLSAGELACFMSHVCIWQKMLDENIQYLAVFEDDVYLGQNAEVFLNQNEWIQPDWHILKLEAFADRIMHDSRGISVGFSREIYKLTGSHLGAAGYILSLKAAEYLMALLRRDVIEEPLDHLLFDTKFHKNGFSLYQMKPAICIQSYLYIKDEQGNFLSTLENQRIERRANESKARTFGEKFNRELNRLSQQFKHAYLKRSIEFK